MTRADRLEALMNRAYRRRKRRLVLRQIAIGFGRTERAAHWQAMKNEAEALADLLWQAWKDEQWAAARAARTAGLVVRYGNADPLPQRPS